MKSKTREEAFPSFHIRVHPWFLPPNPLRSFSLLFLKFVDSLLSLFFQSQNETIVCLSGFIKT